MADYASAFDVCGHVMLLLLLLVLLRPGCCSSYASRYHHATTAGVRHLPLLLCRVLYAVVAAMTLRFHSANSHNMRFWDKVGGWVG